MTELVPIRTSGDAPAAPTGDKSRFVKEIEQALLDGEVDLAVHSAKDVPAELPDGLEIVAAPAAEDSRDALVGAARSLDELPERARVGTSSLRRCSQLRAIRPDLELVGLRGNVDTRLRMLDDGGYDAIVLALAGLRRLGRDREVGAVLAVRDVVPAAGQGILALQARAGDIAVVEAAARINDEVAARRLAAERAVVAALDASCRTPMAAHARLDGDRLTLDSYAGLPDGSEWVRDSLEADASDPAGAGRALADRMLAAGAGDILARAEQTG